MDSNSILEVSNLGLSLKVKEENIILIEDVNFTLKSGSSIALVGESGSGKSLLCKALVRLQPAELRLSGIVKISVPGVREINISSLSEKELGTIRGKRISFLFQEPASSMNPVIKCGRQIFDALPGIVRKNRNLGMKRVAELLELVGLDEPGRVSKSYPHELSGGMIQRVALAAALAGNPSILIADEPFTALDTISRNEILKTLTGLKEKLNLSLIIVLHNLKLALEYSDNLLVMYCGRIMESGISEKISSVPAHPYTKALLDVAQSYSESNLPVGIPGEIPSIIVPPEGCRFKPRCKYADRICGEKEPEITESSHEGFVRCYNPLR